MAISETQKVDYLWKKLGYGLSKTDTNANKRATNESIASPLLLSGENVWGQSDQIPATIPGSSSGVVTVYPTSSPDETTADTSATTNRTWKTELTDWIPPEFGSTYLVKAYIHTAGQPGTAASGGTQVFGAGSGNDDEWFFDYQSGILHFIGTNLPSGISGKSLYISGARYTGIKGVAVPGAGVTFTSTDVESLSVSGLSTFTGAADFNGNVDIDGHTELDQVNVSGVTTFNANVSFGNGASIGPSVFNVNTAATMDGLTIQGGLTLSNNVDADFNGDLDVDGHTELDDVNVSGASTFTGAADFNGDIDVDGRTELDITNISETLNVSGIATFNNGLVVSGVSTFSGVSATSLVSSNTTLLGGFNASGNSSIVGDLTLTDNDAGSAAGPELKLYRNSSTPDDADYLGQIKFAGESDTGVERNYAKITGKILDASNTNEDGILEFAHIKAGSQTITGRFRSDSLQLLNSTNFSVDGTSTFTGAIDANGGADISGGSGLNVTGHTELDTLNVSGVSTLANAVKFTASGSDDGIIDLVPNGTLLIRGGSVTDGKIKLQAHAGYDNVICDLGPTELHYAATGATGGKKLETLGAGVSVYGTTETQQLTVSGVSTFTGAIDANGGLDVSGGSGLVASSAKISDLTDNRIVIAGTAGELEDDSKLTFDGSTFTVQAAANFNGNVSIGGTLTYEDVTSVDSVGLITARKGIIIDSDGLVITSGVATFTDNIQANGNIVGDNSTNISGINQVTATTFVGNLTGTATTATNLANAANITTGTISDDRLPASITSDITGNAATASIATTATNLANAANITTGTISDDRLPASITSDITGNAATASIATTATNLAGGDTGDIPYQSANGTTTFVDATGAGTGEILLWNGSAPVWSSVSGASGNFGGITLQEEGSTVGTAGSVTGLNFVGDNITATASSGIGFGTITVSDTPTFDSLKVTGITTIPNVSGVTTFSDIVNVGSGITIYPATGIISATQFYGGGENLTDLVNQKIEGVMVLADGVPVGTGFTFSNLNFIGNSVSATGVGTTANITITGFDPDADQNLFAGTCAGGTYDPASGTACFNIFVGSCAGKSITEGDYNIFLGQNAGCENITGNNNTFIGRYAGHSNTTGTSNVFLGNNVGTANTTGTKNIYIGSAIADDAVSSCANANIVIGQLTAKCISGDCNIILGCCAGGVSANLTGDHNFIAGYCAGKCQTTGNNNLIIGQNAGLTNSGSSNVMFGTSAGNGNTGAHNFFTGNSAGANNTGDYGVFLGCGAGRCNTSGAGNIFIGCHSGCGSNDKTGSNNVVLGNSTGANLSSGCNNVILGNEAGKCVTSGCCNIFLGYQSAGQAATKTGSNNILLGAGTGKCQASGSNNTFLGAGAGRYTRGSYNIGIGDCAGQGSEPSSSGGCNVSVGKLAGGQLRDGADNVLLGRCAGYNNYNGNDRVAIGCASGWHTTGGDYTVFIGKGTGYYSSGYYNIAIGCGALTGNSTSSAGACNVVIGLLSGRCIHTGNHNVFLGTCAGTDTSHGCSNVFLGAFAGNTNTDGDCNIAIGYDVELPSATGDNQMAIGSGTNRWLTGDSSYNVTIANKLLVNASGIVTASSGIVTYYGDGSQLSGLGESDKITEGNTEVEVIDTGSNGIIKFTTEGSERARIDSSGRMGIGVTNPVAKLEVNVGSAVTAFDIQGSAGQLFSVTNNLTSGSIFSVNDVSGIPSIDVDADGTIQLAPFSTTEMVGVGTTNPTTKLHVIGEVTATDFNSTSDARLKTNVQTIDDPLAKVLQINGVSFNWVENNKPSMGVIADNIEEVLPELVSDTDPKTVNYNGLIGLLIEVVKDQQTQINSLNERLSQLE